MARKSDLQNLIAKAKKLEGEYYAEVIQKRHPPALYELHKIAEYIYGFLEQAAAGGEEPVQEDKPK